MKAIDEARRITCAEADLPPGAFYVGPGSRWANPFVVGGPNHLGMGVVRDQAHALWLYERVLNATAPVQVRRAGETVTLHPVSPALLRDDPTAPLATVHRLVHTHVGDLAGLNLACTCPQPPRGHVDLCHGAVLLRRASDAAHPHTEE